MTDTQNPKPPPDFSADIKGGRTTSKKGAVIQWYDSLTDLQAARNLDRGVLSLASKKEFPGFKKNGKVNWTEAREYLQTNYKNCLEESRAEHASKYSHIDDEVEAWELRKLKADVISKEHANRKTDKEFIKRKPAIQISRRIFGKLFSELERVFCNEAPPKQHKKSDVEIEAMNRVFVTKVLGDLLHQIESWEQKKDLGDDD